MDELALSLEVTHSDGSVERLAPDEPDGEDILQGGSFSTVSPGGFGTLNGQLSRDVSVARVDALDRFDTLRLTGQGGRVAWEGYDIAVPADKGGDSATVGVSGTGWSQTLSDDASLVVIFVTRDLGLLTEPPLLRRVAITAANLDYDQDVHVSSDAHSLAFDGVSGKPVQLNSRVEEWAIAPGGRKFSAFAGRYDFQNASNWFTGAFPSDAEDLGSFDAAVFPTPNDGNVHVVTLTTARKYLAFITYWNAAAGTPPAPAFHATFRNLAFYGSTGLPTQPISGDAPGILASDAINWAVQNGAPLLARNITASTYAIPELSFPDGASAQDILEQANAYENYDYFVWEGPTFYYQPRRSGGTVWRVRTDDGAVLSDQGPQAADTWTGVAVFYSEPTGEAKTVGPPSLASRFDYTDASLEITDSSNVAVAHGRKRIARQNLAFPTTKLGAIRIGAAWLADMQDVEEQGSVTVTGYVRDSAGLPAPAYMMRAGDRIVIENVSASERDIVETSYDIESRQLTATLDSPPHSIDATLARFAASTRT